MIPFWYDCKNLCVISWRIASKLAARMMWWPNKVESFPCLIPSQISQSQHYTFPGSSFIPFLSCLPFNVPFPHQKNRKNKWVSASLFQEGSSPLDGASGDNFREILKQDAMADPLTTLLPSSSMLISTIPSLQAVTKHMKLFTPLQRVWFLYFSIFLWICDDLGETEAGVIGFRDAEILEGGDAGI